MKISWIGRAALPLVLALAGCSKADDYYPAESPGSSYEALKDDPSGGEGADMPNDGGGQHQEGAAGVLTAAEWNDLDNWSFWTKLIRNQQWTSSFSVWNFNTTARVAVKVKDAQDGPAVNVPVVLYRSNTLVWEARTDNTGEVNLWVDLFGEELGEVSAEGLSISVSGVAQAEAPAVTTAQDEEVVWNEYKVDNAAAPASKADIAFIVDATGSMTDEIDFLKKDLLSILESVAQQQQNIEIRTGAVFYRDKGDDYLTRTDAFTTKVSKTMAFIKEQEADGGGDLPEAVHSALEASLDKKNLDWNTAARSRIAFLILDAPAHYDHNGVLDSIDDSIAQFAKMGIRLIPVLASTGDKSTEFMCRYFAIATGGTYVFLTDDSGVGNSHLEPSVGDYKVEKLKDLMIRLIKEAII